MKAFFAIEQPSRIMVPIERQSILSPRQTTFETTPEPARDPIAAWWLSWKLEDHADEFAAMLSIVYLIGAVGFAGLLLFCNLGQ
jgi:hypothetical protein